MRGPKTTGNDTSLRADPLPSGSRAGISVQDFDSYLDKALEERLPALEERYRELLAQRFHQGCSVAESTWEVTLLAWTPAVGFVSSILIAAAALTDAYVQVLCSAIAVHTLLLGNPFQEVPGDETPTWHLSNDPGSGKANWVSLINGSFVFGHVHPARDVNGFAKPVASRLRGPDPEFTLTLLCLFSFDLLIVSDLKESFFFLRKLLLIPRNLRRTNAERNGKAYRLVSISAWRFCFMVFLLLLRSTVATSLLVASGQWLWLSSVSQPDDLLLTRAALVFVLFKTFFPRFIQGLVSSLESLAVQREHMAKSLRCRSLLLIIGCLISIFFMVNACTQPTPSVSSEAEL